MTGGLKEELLQEIRLLAEKYNINKIILFGSRSRGDYRRTSDIDLAVYGGNIASFSVDLDETTTTLLKYDVVNMDGAVQEELIESICNEGVVIYEKV